MSKATVTTTLKLYQAKHKLFPWGHSITDGASCMTLLLHTQQDSTDCSTETSLRHYSSSRLLLGEKGLALKSAASPDSFQFGWAVGDDSGRWEVQAAWTLCPYSLGFCKIFISPLYWGCKTHVLTSMPCHSLLVAKCQISEGSTQGTWHLFHLLPHQGLMVKLIDWPSLFPTAFQDWDEQVKVFAQINNQKYWIRVIRIWQ